MKYGIWFILYFLIFIISLNPTFSFNCINASLLTTLTNPYSCYYIKNVKNKIYNCISRLTNSSIYDLVVINSKNLTINCSFEKALIYNSTHIIIENSNFINGIKDRIILWNSSVILYKNKFIGYVGGLQITNSVICRHYISGSTIGFIVCYPPSLKVKIVLNNLAGFPKGVPGTITLYISSTNNTLYNVWVNVVSSCYANIKVYNATTFILGSGNKIFIPKIKKGKSIRIKFLVRIIDGNKCTFFVNVYSDVTKDRKYIKSYINVLSNESVIYGKDRIVASEYISLTPFLIILILIFA